MKEIKVVRRVLDVNEMMADQNRRRFADSKVFVLNVMSSPGAGKTTLLEKTLEQLMPEVRCAVIVGDICTTNDADRLAKSGVDVVQVNTDEFGGDCHLAAHVIENAAANFDLAGLDLLIVENVGNLVCPAEFELGEQARVMLLSTPEGDDKPSKYPLMFRISNVLIVNKIDLLAHVPFSMEAFRRDAGLIQPDLIIFELSALTGQGLEPWLDWLRERVAERKAAG